MDQDLKAAASLIGPNGTLRLRDVQGHTILAVGGRLWITQEGDSQDIFLQPGQRLTVACPGDTVLQALGGRAAVVVLDPLPAAASDGPGRVPGSLAEVIDGEAERLARQRGGVTTRPSLEQIEREARRLRARALDHLAGRIATAVQEGLRRLRQRLGAVRSSGYAS
jgi:hypothetical protein